MSLLVAGLVLGVAATFTVMGLLAIAAYERGYQAASCQRREWRADLLARHQAGAATFDRTRRMAS